MDSTIHSTQRQDAPAVVPPSAGHDARQRRSPVVPIVVGAGVMVVLALGGLLVWHAESKINKVALGSSPKPVTVIAAPGETFRDSRTYVGTLRPWVEASVGPQFISVYVDTVLVRPGATVKRGDILATLDCRNASASSQAVAAEARAIDARQQAVAHESARLQTLLDGGFVSPNEAEIKSAQSSSDEAQLVSQRARLSATSLQVGDCIMRAPFDGEVATRTIDPGAFVRPGTPIVSVVDRSTIRMTFDVPESDFDLVAPGTVATIRLVATGKTIAGTVSRRSPAADPETRTAHVEIDLADANRTIPVNTTGEVRIEVGEPIHAIEMPLMAASITGSKAAIFTMDGDLVRQKRVKILGEVGSNLYVEPALEAGTPVVTEGWATLADGDRVAAKPVPYEGTSSNEAATKDGEDVNKEPQP
jgi:membrane fusion protein (multidrug efflux system)